MAILTKEEVEAMNFRHVGKNISISNKASFHNCKNISIDDNSRIDDFCVLSAGSGGIFIGKHVHIAVYTSLIGVGVINLADFCNLSSKVAIYSSSDDYSGRTMTNPTISSQFTGVIHADVYLGKHVIIGSGSVILPGVTLEEGVAVGALSLVTKSCKAFGIYAGNPARWIKERKRDLLELEKQFLAVHN